MGIIKKIWEIVVRVMLLRTERYPMLPRTPEKILALKWTSLSLLNCKLVSEDG